MDITVLNTWSWVGLAVDAVIVIWLLSSLIRGAKNGFVYSLVGIAILAVAVVGAWVLSGLLVDPVTAVIRPEEITVAGVSTKQVVRVALAIVLALVIAVVVKILGKGISRTLNDLPLVGGLNQLLGAALSLVVTAALILAILYAWESFFPVSYRKVLPGAPVARFGGEHNLLAQMFGRVK